MNEREDVDRLIERVARLERRTRRTRYLLAAAAIGLGAALLMGQTPGHRSRTIDAETFVLFDDSGKERAQLSVNKDGAVALLLRNHDGVADANLAVLQDGSLNLRMRNPRKSAVLEISAEGTASLRINEKYAKSSVEVGIDGAGKPRFIMTDVEGKAVFKAP